jgi:hypothetical protein
MTLALVALSLTRRDLVEDPLHVLACRSTFLDHTAHPLFVVRVGFFIATSQQDNDLFEVGIDRHQEDAEPLEHKHDLAQLAFLSTAPHRRIVAVHARSIKMADLILSARAG